MKESAMTPQRPDETTLHAWVDGELQPDAAAAVAQWLAERQDVEKAKGILMKTHGVDEDEAYRMLRKKAMQTQRRIGQIAAALIEAHTFL